MRTAFTDNNVSRSQKLRLARFGLALATYVVVILATVIVTSFGIGKMSGAQWAIYIGLAVFGNAAFLFLFISGKNLAFSDPSLTREQILLSSLFFSVALYALPEASPVALLFYLPAFSFGMLRLTREQYLSLVGCVMGLYAVVLGLEYVKERHDFIIKYELFLFILYALLLTWFAFFGGLVSNIRQNLQRQRKEIKNAHEKLESEIEERKRAEMEKDKLIIELKNALQEAKTLSGLLPICASCKKIRDDNGYWNQIETYIQTHSEAEFSHGICPDCVKKLYPDYNDRNA